MSGTPPRIVVLVSGNGSNLQALIDASQEGRIRGSMVGVVSNRAKAFGLQRAERAGIPCAVVRKYKAQSRQAYDAELADAVQGFRPDLVVLAGFMRILTPTFIGRFAKVINLHPALPGELPGTDAIARAWASEMTRTGVMVHEVVEEVDAGPVLGTREVPIDRSGTLDELEAAMHAAEHEVLVEVVARLSR